MAHVAQAKVADPRHHLPAHFSIVSAASSWFVSVDSADETTTSLSQRLPLAPLAPFLFVGDVDDGAPQTW